MTTPPPTNHDGLGEKIWRAGKAAAASSTTGAASLAAAVGLTAAYLVLANTVPGGMEKFGTLIQFVGGAATLLGATGLARQAWDGAKEGWRGATVDVSRLKCIAKLSKDTLLGSYAMGAVGLAAATVGVLVSGAGVQLAESGVLGMVSGPVGAVGMVAGATVGLVGGLMTFGAPVLGTINAFKAQNSELGAPLIPAGGHGEEEMKSRLEMRRKSLDYPALAAAGLAPAAPKP